MSAKKSGGGKKRSGAKKPAGAKKARQAAADDFAGKTVAEFRDALNRNLFRPRDFVMLSRERIEETTERVRERSVEAAAVARRQVDNAGAAARKAADPLLIQADRARRVAGVGAAFPISGYDELTAAQIGARLDTLTPAELRKVRD